jgi:hypothetical protein
MRRYGKHGSKWVSHASRPNGGLLVRVVLRPDRYLMTFDTRTTSISRISAGKSSRTSHSTPILVRLQLLSNSSVFSVQHRHGACWLVRRSQQCNVPYRGLRSHLQAVFRPVAGTGPSQRSPVATSDNGSFATGPSLHQFQPCPPFPESDRPPCEDRMTAARERTG